MKRICLLIALLLLLLLAGCANTGEQRKIEKACFKDTCYQLELAETEEQREKGLSGRQSLDAGHGMLFIYENEGIHSFWMKDTLMQLDIIWLNGDGIVVYISKNTQPCGQGYCQPINPGKNALYVLEVNGGEADRIGLAEGSKVSLV